MDDGKLLKYDDRQLQKVGNAISLTNKLLALNETEFTFSSTELESWWNSLDKEWKDIFKRATRIKNKPSLNEILKIETFKIFPSQIKGLEPIRFLKNLRIVDLNMCDEVTSIEPLANNKELKELNLISTKIDKIETLKHFANLEKLYLPNGVTDLMPISDLLNLRELFFRGCNKIQTLKPISKLINIERLGISDTITDLTPIDSFEKIQRLVCYGVSEKEANRFKKNHPDTEIIFGEKERIKIDNVVEKLRKAANKLRETSS